MADRAFVAFDGRQITYKALRRLPAPPALRSYVVSNADRLDLIAHRLHGDAEQYWRLCDANTALRPDDLLVIGRRLAVPDGSEPR